MRSLRISSGSVDQTLAIGRLLGAAAKPNDVIAISGPLGAGKTVLAKGLAAGLDVRDGRTVNSPTYVIVNEYEGRLHVFHVDVYRLSSSTELAALGFEEMCGAGGVVVVEWAERVRELLPEDHLSIMLQPSGPEQRLLSFACGGTAAERLMGVLETDETQTAQRAQGD